MNNSEIWRIAVALVNERGLHAHYAAMVRASELAAAGDKAGAADWGCVCNAVEEVWRTERGSDESVQ